MVFVMEVRTWLARDACIGTFSDTLIGLILLRGGVSANWWSPYLVCEFCNACTLRASAPDGHEMLPCRIIAL